MSSLDYYFDFSSPYGYLGSRRIEALAERHGRTVDWRPVLIGAMFKITGQGPLTEAPLKGNYALMDFARSAREFGIPYRQPSAFPIGSVAAARTCWWLKTHDDEALRDQLAPFIHAVYRAYYVDDRNISDASTVVAIATSVGLKSDAVEAALADQSVKDLLRQQVDAAVERGVFGSPTIFADEEQFWGSDRLEQVDRWLSRGGW